MRDFIKKPSAWLPIAMSLAALLFTLVWLSVFGVVHQEDEGAGAHIFQLLIGGQLPIITFFVIKWLPQKPKQTIKILVLQFLAMLLAFTPIYLLEL